MDWAALVAGKDEIVGSLRQEKYLELVESYGFEIVSGHAAFTGPNHLGVEGLTLSADAFLLAAGSAPSVPAIPGMEDAEHLTSTTAMTLERLPDSLVVIGGNYMGLEMGQLFADLGVKVTIVEALGRLAPGEEPEVSAWITGARRELQAAEILVATGWRPVLDGQLRTTNPAIWAAGDVTDAPQFVYVTAAQGTLAATTTPWVERPGRWTTPPWRACTPSSSA